MPSSTQKTLSLTWTLPLPYTRQKERRKKQSGSLIDEKSFQKHHTQNVRSIKLKRQWSSIASSMTSENVLFFVSNFFCVIYTFMGVDKNLENLENLENVIHGSWLCFQFFLCDLHIHGSWQKKNVCSNIPKFNLVNEYKTWSSDQAYCPVSSVGRAQDF